MNGLTAFIALDGATLAFDKLYTYLVPQSLETVALAGCRVTVPFGAGNVKKQGMIFRTENAETDGLKPILSVTDAKPVLNAEMLKMCEYMHESCFCTYFDAVHAILPAGLNYKLINYYSANTDFTVMRLLDDTENKVYSYLAENGEKDESTIIKKFGVTEELLCGMCEKQALVKNKDAKRRMRDAAEKWVSSSYLPDELCGVNLTPRQREIARFVSDAGSIGVKELMYYTGVTAGVIDRLINSGVLISFTRQVYRTESRSFAVSDKKEIVLTEEQQKAYDGLLSEYEKEDGAVSLLYGITGSGKTQVFLKLVDKVSAEGLGVIVMVPEIALTPQMLDIFKSRYGDSVAVFHSAMSMGKRMDEWHRVKNGKAKIAVGTRSAVFAPFSRLGLIIMDEEHEHTYKSEQSPRFHARDIARFRTAYHGGLLCLSSATPSVESYTAERFCRRLKRWI